MISHGHICEPLASLNRKELSALLVHDVHRAKGPAVDLQGLPVRLCGVAVAFIIGIGLHDISIGNIIFYQGLHPGSGNDIRAVLLSGVQLYSHCSSQVSFYLSKNPVQSLRGQVAGKIYRGLAAGTLLIGNIMLSSRSGPFLFCHGYSSLSFSFSCWLHGMTPRLFLL